MLMVRDRLDPLPRKEVFLFDYLILFGYNLLLNGQIGILTFCIQMDIDREQHLIYIFTKH